MDFLVALFLALPAVLQTDSLRVQPTWGIAGHYGTWTVTWEVGPEGLRAGGARRVQLPDTWHAGLRNSANRLQATDPEGDHYVSAEASRAGVELTTEVESESPNFLVKASHPGLDGRMERYVHVVRVTVAAGELQAGDAIRVVYGDTRGDSRGMRAAIVSTRPEPILAAVDRDGGAFEPVSHEATLTARSGLAVALRLSGPATLVAGEPADLNLAAGGPPREIDLEPDALDFSWSGVDGGFRDDAIYYVWVRQRGHVRGRVVMAWSSPVWITRAR